MTTSVARAAEDDDPGVAEAAIEALREMVSKEHAEQAAARRLCSWGDAGNVCDKPEQQDTSSFILAQAQCRDQAAIAATAQNCASGCLLLASELRSW